MMQQQHQTTLLQTRSRPALTAVITLLLILHLTPFMIGLVFAPLLLHSAEYSGSSCSVASSNDHPTWYEPKGGASWGNCAPLADGDRAELRKVINSFRFPRTDDEVSSYSPWNWRLLASLSMDLTFFGSAIPEFADDELVILEDMPETTVPTPVFTIVQKVVRVLMKAKIDLAPMADLGNASWRREASIFAERSLQCTLSRPLQDLVKSEAMVRTAQYICGMSQLLDLQLPDNNTYIVSLEFLPDWKNDSNDDRGSSSAVDVDSAEYYAFFEHPSNIRSSLTLVLESKEYHTCLFYLKCVSAPFVLASLVWFCMRLYLNDLYISIPDRLLIACAFTQFVQDIPTELVVAQWPHLHHLKLMDELAYASLLCSLLLFWVVYAGDKLATNEPWERNTRFYWKQLATILLSCLLLALYSVYGMGSVNPFDMSASSSMTVNLGFVFGLAVLAMAYEVYLSILVLRLIFSARGNSPKRTRGVVLYSFSVSLLTAAGLMLKLAMRLSLYWNQQLFVDPVPAMLAYSSPFLLGLQGLWNLHVVSLLVLLSRGESCHLQQPVRYHQQQQVKEEHDVTEELGEIIIEEGVLVTAEQQNRKPLFTLEEDEREQQYRLYPTSSSSSTSSSSEDDFEEVSPVFSSGDSHDYGRTHSS